LFVGFLKTHQESRQPSTPLGGHANTFTFSTFFYNRGAAQQADFEAMCQV
jgi:hypothetical protein